ncbi:ATPase [bacterium]|nr:ATPase [bacterium]
MNNFSSSAKKILLLTGFLCVMYFFTMSIVRSVSAEPAQTKPAITHEEADLMKWGFMAAAISVGLGSIAAGIAVAHVGSAALGVIGERPEMAPRALIFVGLAEGIAIYGLVMALMILFKI